MSAAEINARFIMDKLKTQDPTISQIETALRLIRSGDLIHVDLIRSWVMSQSAAFRGDLLNDLQELAAEEEHLERQRLGAIDRSYAATSIRQAGRGHLIGEGV